MSDVFLSYTKNDRTKAQALVARFHKFKWSVWWDQSIEGGEEWKRSVDSELRSARVVVVLWSAQSILSEWVRHEAADALSR